MDELNETYDIQDQLNQFDVIKIDTDEKREQFIIETLVQIEAPATLELDDEESVKNAGKEIKNNHTYNFLNRLFKKFNKFIVIVEYDYIDRTFRDSYYEYYAFKYHEYERNCKRLCIFDYELENELDGKYFIDVDTSILQNHFIGSMVIRPIPERSIGHTLINPKYVLLDDKERVNKEKSIFLRTSMFRINLCGHKLYIRAFPFSMQDLATTTCAETMLIGLMEYYNNEYSDYSRLYPSDIKRIARDSGYERTLPSKGLSYEMISKILSCAGFEPRLVLSSPKTRISKLELKKIMHYYVESGIPIGVGVTILNNNLHTCTCIGHGEIHYDRIKDERVLELNTEGDIYFINSQSLVDDYVFVDDNKMPYTLYKCASLSQSNGMKTKEIKDLDLKALNIPLYKKMCLALEDAREIFLYYLSSKEHGIKKYFGSSIATKDNPIVLRLFICSAKSFKTSRLSDLKNFSAHQTVYANLKLPKFIEVCEIYTKDDYEKGIASGKILLDATASVSDKAFSLILINYGGQLTVMDNKNNSVMNLLQSDDVVISEDQRVKFPGYKKNLMNIYDVENNFSNKAKK